MKEAREKQGQRPREVSGGPIAGDGGAGAEQLRTGAEAPAGHGGFDEGILAVRNNLTLAGPIRAVTG